MSDKLEALKAAALAATPGPWVEFLSGDTFAVHTPSDKHCGDIVNWPGFDGSKNAANNAAFIAAVNPAVVLELLAALEEANKRAERLNGMLDNSMRATNAAEQREEHLKATVDVLSAKNAELEREKTNIAMLCADTCAKAKQKNDELERRLQHPKPIKLPDVLFIKISGQAVAVMSAIAIKERIRAAGHKVEGE